MLYQVRHCATHLHWYITTSAYESFIPQNYSPSVLDRRFCALCGVVRNDLRGGPEHAVLSPGGSLRSPTCRPDQHFLAVAADHPVFTWTLDSRFALPCTSVRQSAFQVQVFAGSKSALLWDSGIVHSNSTDARYEGPALDPIHVYSVRVRAWDEQDHPTSWSAALHWTQAPDWQPQWIAAGNNADTDPLPIFRKSFDVHRRVVRALLYATGLGQDEVRLNGKKIGNDELAPGWSEYHKTIFYDTYDVTANLQPGANAIGVLLGNGMYRVLKTEGRYTKFTGTYGPPKCALRLHLEFADGQATDIVTDATWKTLPGPVVFSSTYGGEDFDARHEPLGWDRPGFDDAQWQPAALADGPGGKLQPEIAPPLRALHAYSPVKSHSSEIRDYRV